MKIAMSGAQSTGKSTVINLLKKKKEFKNYIFCQDVARGIKRAGHQINADGDENTQILVMAKHMNNFVEPNAIFDRCALDGLVYTTYLYQHNKVSEQILSMAEEIFLTLSYDVLFYIKPEFELVPDSVRSADLVFRDEIVNIFNDILESFKVPYVALTGDRYERVDIILDWHKSAKKRLK